MVAFGMLSAPTFLVAGLTALPTALLGFVAVCDNVFALDSVLKTELVVVAWYFPSRQFAGTNQGPYLLGAATDNGGCLLGC